MAQRRAIPARRNHVGRDRKIIRRLDKSNTNIGNSRREPLLLRGWTDRRRVVRGGAFNNNDRNVRCAIRNRNNPDNRNENQGFRVVVSHAFPVCRKCDAGVCFRHRGFEKRCGLFLAGFLVKSGEYKRAARPRRKSRRAATRITDLTGFIRTVIDQHFCMDTNHRQPDPCGNLSGLELYDWDNLLLAYRKASRGKRGHADVAEFEYRLEDNLLQLQRELRDQTYQPGKYHSFYIHDPKTRLISAAPFRDRVVHHALCNIIEPVFERSFIFDSYANRIGKGTHKAIDRAQQFARRFKYVLTCDIRQFFPSIDHEILSNVIASGLCEAIPTCARRLLRAEEHRPRNDIMWLIQKILQSGEGILQEEYDMVYFAGDDLFSVNRPRGLPIGNLTSQFWANCYLSPFDHFVKRNLRCKGYVRYVDDFLLFSNDRGQLNEWRGRIIQRLEKYRLTLHENKCQPRPVTEGIPFLGFILYPEHRLLKRKKGIAFQRKYKLARKAHQRGELSFANLTASVQGWVNHVCHANTWHLRLYLLTR
jgi:RNA-directed DNA polymerase